VGTSTFKIVIALAAVAVPACAQQEIDASEFGFRFTPPASWTASKIPIGYALTATKYQGMILLLPHAETDMNRLRQQAAEGLQDGSTTNLKPTGAVQSVNATTVGVDLAGTIDNQPAKARALAMLSPNGGGVVILVGSPAAVFTAEYAALADVVARTIKFTKLDASTAIQYWEKKLRGRPLHQFSRYSSTGGGSYAGYSEHNVLNLCADGTFAYQGDFSGAISVPGANASMANRGPKTGTWKLVPQLSQAALELTTADGAKNLIALSADGTKTLLNGKQWLVDDKPAVCR